MDSNMSEPVSSAAASIAGWKILGGTASVLGIGAALASLVVMLMTRPKTDREWTVGLTSTVVGSIGGGAYAIIKFGLLVSIIAAPDDLTLFFTLCAALGFVFTCGLPAWAIVRLVFVWIGRQDAKGADIVSAVKELKETI
jgi:hypothetical protein